MSIGEIKSNCKNQKKRRDEIELQVSKNYEESLFYSKDFLSNQANFSLVDKGFTTIKSNISSIKSKINTKWATSFHNTYDSLSRISIPDSITEKIREIILKASKASWEKYRKLYENNLKYIDTAIKQVEGYIAEYNKLNIEISRLISEIAAKRNKLLPNGAFYDTSYYESKKTECEKRQKQILKIANQTLIQIENANNKNVTELLSKGLARA